MSDLQEFQSNFISFIQGDELNISGYLKESRNESLTKERSLKLYRNNHFATLLKSLERCFPVFRILIGENAFKGFAVLFIREHPCQSRKLIEYSNQFISFVIKKDLDKKIPFASDLMRFEFAQIEVLHTSHARVYKSRHPIFALWIALKNSSTPKYESKPWYYYKIGLQGGSVSISDC